MTRIARNKRTAKLNGWLALFAATLCIVVMPCAGLLSAQESGSLDAQLFEDLTEDLFDDIDPLDDSKPNDVVPQDEPANAEQRRRSNGIAEDNLGARSVPNPLSPVVDAMRSVQGRLARRDLAVETRNVQNEIVSSFDELIERLRQQKQQQDASARRQSQSKSPQRNQSQQNQPQDQSQDQSQDQQQDQSQQSQSRPSSAQQQEQAGKNNSGGKPTDDATSSSLPNDKSRLDTVAGATGTEARNQLMQQAWGNLPAGVRQEMQSSRPEKFLPAYSGLIEAYFKRLSEQESK